MGAGGGGRTATMVSLFLDLHLPVSSASLLYSTVVIYLLVSVAFCCFGLEGHSVLPREQVRCTTVSKKK